MYRFLDARGVYLFIKRFFDVMISIMAISFLIIPWIVISCIIKLKSFGPIFYKPQRSGKNGKPFVLYKFRSMRCDSGRIHATTLRNDSRVFPFGAFLRKSKLDETPQFINILKGEMTIIGPRPEDLANVNRLYLGKYSEILSVKPGLSSPASIFDYTHGETYSNEEEYIKEFEPKKLDLDLYYVHKRSFIYDMEIFFRTIVAIIQVLLGKKNIKEPRELKIIYNSNNKTGYRN